MSNELKTINFVNICKESKVIIHNLNEKNFKTKIKEIFGLIFEGYYFRGIKIAEHLLPTLLRYYDDIYDLKKPYSLNKLDSIEDNLIDRFCNFSIQNISCYENPLDLLASAQHFGIPTRIVDWTKDPLIAIYFAINRLEKGESAFLVAMKNEITENISINNLKFENKNLSKFFNNIDDKFDLIETFNLFGKSSLEINEFQNCIDKNKIFLFTNNANNRIKLQRGIFQLFCFKKLININNVLIEIENLLKDFLKDCIVYKIKYKDKKTILNYLEKFSINQMTMFDDLENTSDYIKNLVKNYSK